MKATNITKLTKLIEVLDLMGLSEEAETIIAIIKDEAPKPKAPPKPKEKLIEIDVVEGAGAYTMTFETSAKFEKWAKEKVKTRKELIHQWQMSEKGLKAPIWDKWNRQDARAKYNQDCAEYLEAIEKAGLNFQITIRQ